MNPRIANNRRIFLNFLSEKYPSAFNTALQSTKKVKMLSEVGGDNATTIAAAAESEPWYTTLLNSVGKLVTTLGTGVAQYNLQRDVNEMNLERIRQGLEPVDASTLGTSINVGVSAQTQKILTYALLGAGLLLALFIMKKK